MLQAKKSLEDYLGEQYDKIILDNDKCKKIYNYANETYGIPKGLVSDLISKRMEMSEISIFVLFILLDSLHNIGENTNDILTIDKFFTMQEAQTFRKAKYTVEKIEFPLVFKMVQISDDQWVGKISIDMLMKLRQAQLINYNANAQRTMQRILKGGKESYKITLNQKAVKQIQTSFETGSFIPNTITLNLPTEIDADFYYDEETCSLVIKSLDHFDISDGYHRFIAACQIKDINKEFDYPMELRIVNFSEDKAKQFIFQEDQKTKMKKVDSNSMNMNKSANIVVTRLNEDIRCNIKGLISRNEGTIPFGDLAELVDYFYFRNEEKEKERSIIIKAVKELSDNFNMLTEYNTDYLEKKMPYRVLLSAMFCFDYFKDKDKSRMCKIIEIVADKIQESDNKKFRNKTPRKPLMNEIEKFVKECE